MKRVIMPAETKTEQAVPMVPMTSPSWVPGSTPTTFWAMEAAGRRMSPTLPASQPM